MVVGCRHVENTLKMLCVQATTFQQEKIQHAEHRDADEKIHLLSVNCVYQ